MTTETNPSGALQIPEKDRMTGDQIDEATKGYKGRERWQAAARIAEQRGYELGLEDGLAQFVDPGDAEERAAEITRLMAVWGERFRHPDIPSMVPCHACNGTGKMYTGSQCKVCYGATVVKVPLGTAVVNAESNSQ